MTVPRRAARPVPPAFPAAYNYGNASIRVELSWPNGTLAAGIFPDGGARATINPDGSIRAKVGWWRGVPGQLVAWGRRLDAPAKPLRSEVGAVASYGHLGFVPSAIIFPTVGCWRVVGGVKHARLSFVVHVTKITPR